MADGGGTGCCDLPLVGMYRDARGCGVSGTAAMGGTGVGQALPRPARFSCGVIGVAYLDDEDELKNELTRFFCGAWNPSSNGSAVYSENGCFSSLGSLSLNLSIK